jgi:hypothetical protein
MAIERDDLARDPTRAWVRMTTFDGSPEVVDQAMQAVSRQLAPLLRTAEGWQRTMGLMSQDGRQGILLSFWEDHSAMLGSEATTFEVRRRGAEAGLGVDVERLELLFDEQ